MKTLLDLRVWKLAGLMFALASSFASVGFISQEIIGVIRMPLRFDGITVTYRWESLPSLYAELGLLILGEILIWLFLLPKIYGMLSKRK